MEKIGKMHVPVGLLVFGCLWFPFTTFASQMGLSSTAAYLVTALYLVAAGLGLLFAKSRSTLLLPGLVLAAALSAYWQFSGPLFFWPVHLLIPILATLAVVGVLTGTDQWRQFARLGRFDFSVLSLVAITVLCSVAGLFLWRYFSNVDLAQYRALIPVEGVLLTILAGLAFSIFNAVLEEFVWRGIFLNALRERLGTVAAVLIASASFALAHIEGVPSGAAGAVLSGIYGVLLSIIAIRSGGLGAAILAHIFADIVIFSLFLSS